MTIEEKIKNYASDLGFCKVGITTVDDFPRAAEETRRRAYPKPLLEQVVAGTHPRGIVPEARSIIVLAYDYSHIAFPAKLARHIGHAYLSRTFIPQPGSPARDRLDAFEAFLEQEGIPFVPDRVQVNIRAAAQRAGVASYGRNNFSYVDGVGSFVTLYAYFVMIDLKPDDPAPDCACPPNCRACVDACPTHAMAAPFDLDAEKCIVWNNAVSVRFSMGRDVPEDMRESVGEHVHGCDECQIACPRNRRALRNAKDADPLLEAIAAEFSLENLLHMPDGFFERCVKPIMYNYVSNDPAIFQRNAAIAMGNSGDVRFVPDLEGELDHPDEAVRKAVRWALEQIRG